MTHADSPLDLALRCRGSAKPASSTRPYDRASPSYAAFIALCFEQMRGRDPDGQRDITIGIMRSLMPPGGESPIPRVVFRRTGGASSSTRDTKIVFAWMVGPMEVRSTDENDLGEEMMSRVHPKCRWLQRATTAMCVNMCKTATQDFFANDAGMPLTIKPNFEDKSCDFYFGPRRRRSSGTRR